MKPVHKFLLVFTTYLTIVGCTKSSTPRIPNLLNTTWSGFLNVGGVVGALTFAFYKPDSVSMNFNGPVVLNDTGIWQAGGQNFLARLSPLPPDTLTFRGIISHVETGGNNIIIGNIFENGAEIGDFMLKQK